MAKKYASVNSKELNYLQSGAIIDQYMIERELAHGGFSSVYLARQINDQVQVAIKEYFPRKLAHRTINDVVVPNDTKTKGMFLKGRALFFEEAKFLASLKHSNIVDVINFFQANETVYMVMTYDYGLTLDKIIKKKKLKVTENLIFSIFNQLLAGVSIVHEQNKLHLDIKPSNILIRPYIAPLLLDFGAIQSYPASPQSYRARVLTHGFSPVEQCSIKSPLGPWTDIYAIGASMRYCLDSKIPTPASDRASKNPMMPATKVYNRKYPNYLLQAMDWAMQIKPEDRPQSIKEFQQFLVS